MKALLSWLLFIFLLIVVGFVALISIFSLATALFF